MEPTLVARLPFADIERADIKPLAGQIAAERGTVLDLYRMLLHSPPVAAGWLRYLTAIRHECELPGSLRELVIMRIAILNGASYESEQHAAIALGVGIAQGQLNDLPNWNQSERFSDLERSVLAYTDMLTHHVRVTSEVFEAVRKHCSDRIMVELTATIGAYNMVSRFLEALEIHASHESHATA
jgi:alkylhydroperoxidase family enzyme